MNRHVVFCFLFLLHFNHRPPKLAREREKEICDVLLKKKLEKKIWDQKKNYSIFNSRVHVGWHRQSQWIKITTVQLLHIVTYPCCHHMIWKDRSIKHCIWIFLNPKKVSHHWSPTFLFLFLVATLLFYVFYHHSLCSFHDCFLYSSYLVVGVLF